MKISEYIKHLESVQSEIGDVEVQSYGFGGDRHTAPMPSVALVKLLSGREHKPRFWSTYDGDERKGAPVCRV